MGSADRFLSRGSFVGFRFLASGFFQAGIQVSFRPSQVLTILLLIVTVVCLLILTRPAGALSLARWQAFALAAVVYSASFAIFGGVWSYMAARAVEGSRDDLSKHPPYGRGFAVSIASLVGILSPMNLGTDVLRSLYGRKYLGMPVVSSAAASIITREYKLHVTLALVLLMIPLLGSRASGLGKALWLVAGGLAALIACICLIRANRSAGLAGKLRMEKAVHAVRDLSSTLNWNVRGACYFVFVLSFGAEWWTLSLCFHAVGIQLQNQSSLAVFGIVYFLARAPLVPMGIGLVETGGVAILRAVGVPAGAAGAILILWGTLRVGIPLVAGGVFAAGLLLAGGKACSASSASPR